MVGQGDLGAMAGEGLSKLFGWGDYRTAIKGNSLMAGVSGNSVPKFSGDGKRGVRLTEREFIGNILASTTATSGSTVFNNQFFPLNPTSSATFPWLSKIAHLFDQWEPHGIVFEFHTTSSTFNGTSQALGAVIMATDYDSYDPLYANKQVMENADYACSSVPSCNLLHGVECDPKERPLKILYTSDRAAQKNFSSLGNFQIATQGCSVAGVTLGELWVSYDITFYKKQLEASTISGPDLSLQMLTTVGGPLIFPTDVLSQNEIEILQLVGVGTRVLLPPNATSGNYLATYYRENLAAGDVLANWTPTNLVNCTFTQLSTSLAIANENFFCIYRFQVIGQNASFQLGLSQAATTNNFTIVQVPDGVDATDHT
jgi:hypothetical protein